jgi:hypothetical protein
MILLDEFVFKEILRMTIEIMQKKFYYSQASIERFVDRFVFVITNEYCAFEENTDCYIKTAIRSNKLNRRAFTSDFVSYHLYDILVDDMHFSEQEIDLFLDMLPQPLGVKNTYAKQNYKRTKH